MPRRRAARSPAQLGAAASCQLCVCARKKHPETLPPGCAPRSRALSLAPSLSSAPSLPPFANIGFKPAQDSAQRKAAGSRSSSRSGSRSPEGHRSLKMYHPACWVVFSATTALLFIPGTGRWGGRGGGGAICGAGGAELPEQERRGGRRAQGGRRECELRARERGAGGVHARTHSHARSCLQHGLGSRSQRCEPVSWVRVCTALRCEALLLLRRGPRGINQLWSQG